MKSFLHNPAFSLEKRSSITELLYIPRGNKVAERPATKRERVVNCEEKIKSFYSSEVIFLLLFK